MDHHTYILMWCVLHSVWAGGDTRSVNRFSLYSIDDDDETLKLFPVVIPSPSTCSFYGIYFVESIIRGVCFLLQSEKLKLNV